MHENDPRSKTKIVGVSANLQLYVGYDVVNSFIEYDYSGIETI